MSEILRGKKGVVTGGGRGIGRAVALLLAKNGADVMICSRNETELKETAQLSSIERNPGTIETYRCDVSREDDVVKLFAHTGRAYRKLDILVNNAGVFSAGSMENMSSDTLRKDFEANCVGMFVACREAFPYMKDNGGSIVNVTSLSGVLGAEKFPGFGSYIVSKFGVTGLTEALAVEWKDHGIRVNAVAPGAVDTEMLRAAAPDLEPVLSPVQVAETILFLVGPASSGVNGAVVQLYSHLLREERQ